MKCQKCGNNNANTHVKTIVNGEITEYELCSDCAKKMGYINVFGDMESEFSNFLGSFFGNALPARTQATHCDFCGSTYSDIVKTGQVGCANCYEVFESLLLPSIRRIHGNTTHCGKNSKLIEKKVAKKQVEKTEKERVQELNIELEKAIKEQNFEYAAELRDKIKGMEG